MCRQEPWAPPASHPQEIIKSLPHKILPALAGLLAMWCSRGRFGLAGSKKIKVHLYEREYETESYDITPGAEGLDDAQEKIASFLLRFLASTLGKEQLSKVFTADDPFFVDWDAFYRGIDEALVNDGFERYKHWALQVAEDPDILEFAPSKKRRATEELPDWLRSISKPAIKKPKKAEDTSSP